MTGREIKDTLERAGVLPSKQLGQNFLIDPNMARWIVSQLEITADDAVVEVGPGTGSLSEHLVGKVRKLILIEFDARLAAALTERFKNDPSVEVHHADGVKFDGRQLFKHRPLKFLGNLPYSCGGAILKNLLSRPHPFDRAVIMLQKEVIDRLGANPGTKDYGILSLRTQANWDVKSLRTVPPEAFYPQPKIDSSVAVLTPRVGGLPTFDYRLFDELIRRGFAQRRKQLKKQLPDGPPWEDITTEFGVAATVRGEELTLAQWVDLTRAYDPHPLKDVPQKDGEIFDVVDAEDQVTGTATRAEVHAQKLTHRAVHVFVFNKRGDLLLQKRSLLKDMCPGLWDSSASGHLDSGESYEAAAVRELEEEMGIISEAPPEEVARITPGVNTGWEHVRLYQTRHDGNLRFPSAEVDAVMWFPLAEIAAWIASHPADFAPGFLECWEKFTAL
ncbi:MAG: ribosomal RNA small subunit methyltransferase A [Gloeobacteraceae cyanobacterium ES-bin-144]|nr:ribosomal RNA small subunit methyltransferase A [Verrucomicrobiales bacterium]